MGKEGLELLKQVREETGLLIVTELLDPRDAGLVAQYADVIQIGARNMQNFRLLLEVGKLNIPVLLKTWHFSNGPRMVNVRGIHRQ